MHKITLKEAVKFHGHLGPYLVLGLLAGDLALKKLKSKKYFGLDVSVRGADKKPKSCLIDGLQLSTGATYGKGNIRKTGARGIKIIVTDKSSGRKAALSIKKAILREIEAAEGHAASETLAKKLFKQGSLFNLAPVT
ncbi:MAG: FmdE family protein [Candidatus Omnitrophota bacterium]